MVQWVSAAWELKPLQAGGGTSVVTITTCRPEAPHGSGPTMGEEIVGNGRAFPTGRHRADPSYDPDARVTGRLAGTDTSQIDRAPVG